MATVIADKLNQSKNIGAACKALVSLYSNFANDFSIEQKYEFFIEPLLTAFEFEDTVVLFI
jgi:hypothetical protein